MPRSIFDAAIASAAKEALQEWALSKAVKSTRVVKRRRRRRRVVVARRINAKKEN